MHDRNRLRGAANGKGDVLRSRTARLLSTTVMVAAFAGYGRNAYAACVLTSGSSYQCSGAETTAQAVNADNAAVSTLPDFSVDTSLSGGNALAITGNGAISYTDAEASPLTAAETALVIHATGDDGDTPGGVDVETNGTLSGGTYGIDARNSGSGALTIAVTGDVTGDTAVGIRARNYTGSTPLPYYPYSAPYADGTDITVTTGAGTTVTGGQTGILAQNLGSGVVTIIADGDVHGYSGNGIDAINSRDGQDLIVTTGTGTSITGTYTGIRAEHAGTGALTVTVRGDVSGEGGYGVSARNFTGVTPPWPYPSYALGTDVAVTTAAGTTVSGRYAGIRAINFGSGDTTVITDGNVVGYFGGIRATQNSPTGELNITVNGDVTTTYGTAITAERTGGGNVRGVPGITIVTNGDLVSEHGFGIQARNDRGGDIAIGIYGNVTALSTGIRAVTVDPGNLDITTAVGTTVSGNTGMDARADGHLTITTDGDVLGVFGGIEARAYDEPYFFTGAELVIVANGAVTGRYGAIEATNFGTGILSITVAGEVSSSGQDGIYAERQYSDGGNIEIVVESTGTVHGAESGVEIASNSGLSTVENAGTIRNTSGLTTAVAITSATAGDVEITNTGTVIGTVMLAGGDDVFNEQSLNSWHTAGGTNDFGAGANVINNDGRIVAAEVGASGAVTTIFQATGGTLAFNSDAGGVLDMSNGVVGDVSRLGNAGQFNGTFIANGGIVQIDTELGNDSSLTDLMVINGNTVLGTSATRLHVVNVGGAGGQTVAGIKVVDVTGSSAAGAFSLLGDFAVNGQQAVAGGAYSYSLFQGTPTTDDGDWYLRSIGFSPSATAHESYPGVLLSLIDMPTLQQRVGNVYMPNTGSRTDGYVDPEPAADVTAFAPAANFWTRIDAAYGHVEGDSDTGTEYDLDRYRIQVGIDGRLGESEAGIFIGGINVQYGHAHADLGSDTGGADNSTDSYGGGLTLTWLGASGFYADAQAAVHYLETDLKSDALGDLVDNNEGWGYGLSLELGRKAALDHAWSITPQAQLAYTSVDFDDFDDEQGVDVSLDEGESLKGRLGLALGYDSHESGDSRGHVYAIANVTYEFLDAQSVDIAGVNIEVEQEEWGGELGLGGTYEWAGGRYAIHGEALGQTSFEGSYGVKGTAGFSTRF